MTAHGPVGTAPDDASEVANLHNTPRGEVAMAADEYRPLEETSRAADVRSPLRGEYSLAGVMEAVLGRESATCEACQETIHLPAGGDLTDGEPFVLRKLIPNVYTVENQVLLCESCANRPADTWRADVRAKRAHEREGSPTWMDRVSHWVSDPRAGSVFARRLALVLTGLVALVLTVAWVAGLAGTLSSDLAVGVAWAQSVLTVAATGARAVSRVPWVVGSLIGLGYTAHAVERARRDPRGYRSRDAIPWVRLAVAGAIGGVGTIVLIVLQWWHLPAPSLVHALGVTLWFTGALGVAWYIDLAIRHDLAVGIWNPSRAPWMIAARVGLLPGALALSVGFPLPVGASGVTTWLLAALPTGVGLGFASRRLPADPQARDAILERLPERVRTALTDRHRRN